MKKLQIPAVLMLSLLFLPTCKKEEPEAFFTVQNNNCVAPCEVEFQEKSKNAITVRWDFGDDNTEQDVSNTKHLYTLPGEYTVTLVAINPEGSSSHSETVRILAPPPLPTVGFSFTNNNCAAPCDVSFTHYTQNADSFEWDFGDGSPRSTLPNPTHIYLNAGQYPVTLTATGQGGSNTATNTVTIQDQQTTLPIASFTTSKTQYIVGETVNFNNTSLNANSYSWDFGDGRMSVATNPSITYDAPGSYTVKLTARNSINQSDTEEKTIYVTTPGPTKVFFEKLTISNIPDFWLWDTQDDTGPDLTFNLRRYLGNDQWEKLLEGYYIIYATNPNGNYSWTCDNPDCELFNWDDDFVVTVIDVDFLSFQNIADSDHFVLNNLVGQTQVDLSNGGMTITLQLRWE